MKHEEQKLTQKAAVYVSYHIASALTCPIGTTAPSVPVKEEETNDGQSLERVVVDVAGSQKGPHRRYCCCCPRVHY